MSEMLFKIVTGRKVLAVILPALLAFGGCAAERQVSSASDGANKPPEDTQDVLFTDAVLDSGVRSALIEEHTLFPYHFDTDSDALNGLGERDLAVLSEHLKTVGGNLSIRQGPAESDLYAKRIAYVKDALVRAGVDMTRVHISDDPAAGEGMTGQEAVRYKTLENVRDEKAAGGGSAESSKNEIGTNGPNSSDTGNDTGGGTGTGGGGQ